MKNIFYWIWQCTWGILQTTVGAVFFLLHRKDRHFIYHGAVVTEWKSKSSISLGMFVFVSEDPFFYYPHLREKNSLEEFSARLLVHEYGHTIQSLLLGPAYLPVVGFASALWSYLPYFERLRKQGMSYFDFFPEKWANTLGEKVTKCQSMGNI